MFITVDPALGIKTLPQLIERAKKEPGKISIAVSGIGRLTHFTSELLQARADIKLLLVPYTHSMASAIADVSSGRVSLIIENYSGVVGAVKAGQLKLLATASPERLPEFPDLPTVAETLPGFSATGWQVLVAPIGTPAPIISKVSADLRKAVSDADFKKRLAAIGSYSRAMTPEEVLAFVAKEQQHGFRWSKEFPPSEFDLGAVWPDLVGPIWSCLEWCLSTHRSGQWSGLALNTLQM